MSASFNQYAAKQNNKRNAPEVTNDYAKFQAFLEWQKAQEAMGQQGAAAAMPERDSSSPPLKRAKREPTGAEKEQAAAAAASVPDPEPAYPVGFSSSSLSYSSSVRKVSLNVPLPTLGCGSVKQPGLFSSSVADEGQELRLAVFKERRPSEPPSGAGRVDVTHAVSLYRADGRGQRVAAATAMPTPPPAAVKSKEYETRLGSHDAGAAAAAAAHIYTATGLTVPPAQAGGSSSTSSSADVRGTSGDSIRSVIDQMPITLVNGEDMTLMHPQIGSVVPLHLIPNRMTHWICDGSYNPAEERFVTKDKTGQHWVPVRPGPNQRWNQGPCDPPMFLSAKFRMTPDRAASLKNDLTASVRAKLRSVAVPLGDLVVNFKEMTKMLTEAQEMVQSPIQDVEGLVSHMRGLENTYSTLRSLKNTIGLILATSTEGV